MIKNSTVDLAILFKTDEKFTNHHDFSKVGFPRGFPYWYHAYG